MTAKALIIPIVILIAVLVYKTGYFDAHSSSKEMRQFEEETYMRDNHLILLSGNYYWYDVKEHREMKPITDALDYRCKNDFCKIENYFNYVKKMDYATGNQQKENNSVDLVMKGQGDCDERSYLLASMMLQNGYETIIIYTQDHAFAGVHIPNYSTNEPRSYLEHNHKKFYYAETTDPNAYLGGYNGIDTKKFKAIYSVNEKKEIPLGEVHATIFTE